jgi:hypothetical protein
VRGIFSPAYAKLEGEIFDTAGLALRSFIVAFVAKTDGPILTGF